MISIIFIPLCKERSAPDLYFLPLFSLLLEGMFVVDALRNLRCLGKGPMGIVTCLEDVFFEKKKNSFL